MKCKVKLFHVESDTKWSIKKDFGYDNKNAGWTKNKLSYEKLMKYDTITFRAEIEILSLFDLRGNKSIINPTSSANYKYQAKRAYDDGSIGNETNGKNKHKKKKSGIMNRGNRSKTATASTYRGGGGGNPYGGYGSHNYQHYFNDGYKKNQNYQQNPQQNEQKKESENDDDDDDDYDDEDEDGGQSSEDEEDEDSELELETISEMEEQVKFLVKEYKKLNKIIQNLKQKHNGNQQLIAKLQSDIQALKGGIISSQAPSSYDNQQSKPSANNNKNTNGNGGGGGLLDLFGDLGSSPNQQQTQENNDTFATGNNDNGFSFNNGGNNDATQGWTTF